MSLWQDYLHTQFDPAHLLSELGFTLLFDIVVLALVVKPFVARLKNAWHQEIDDEHGVVHGEPVHEEHRILDDPPLICLDPPLVRVTCTCGEQRVISAV